MPQAAQALARSTHFTAADFGALERWSAFEMDHPRRGRITGKTFLGQVLGLTGMEVSFGSMAPGETSPFCHSHKQNEELYVFLTGQGEMQVDGERFPLQAGTAIRIEPAGVRAWRATGTEPLTFLVIQAKAGSLEQATASDGVIAEQPLVW